MVRWPDCTCVAESREDEVWFADVSVSEGLGGIGREVTICVTDFEKNFSSRCIVILSACSQALTC